MRLAGDPAGWRAMAAGLVLSAGGHEVFVPADSVRGYDDAGVDAEVEGLRCYFAYSTFALGVIAEERECFLVWSSEDQATLPRR